MKAVVCAKYGSPDVLQIHEIEKPTPKDNEVLIRIHGSAVTTTDIAFRKGEPLMMRVFSGLTKPKFIPGGVLAGEVESVGKDVKSFRQGDQVFGASSRDFGAYAEYKCLPEDGLLAVKPSNITYEEAVGFCDGATTALTFLRDKAKLQSGQKILVNGASGAVGTAAVQLAKHYGAEVTGVCSTKNLEMVRSLGADRVIDYTAVDFTQSGQVYDTIFDAVGKRSFFDCKRALSSNGVYLTPVPSLAVMLQMLRTSRSQGKKAIFAAAGLEQNRDHLRFLGTLFEAGKIKTVIDRCYPLDQIAEAQRYVEKGHKRGSVVVSLVA